MKRLLPILIAFVIGCSSGHNYKKNNAIKTNSINDSLIVSFTNNHINKYVAGNLEAAYDDYMSDFKTAYTFEQFKNVFDKQIIPTFGILKSAEYKSIAYGKNYSSANTYEIATLFYKAEIDKPKTFIRIEVVTSLPKLYVLSYQYINFVNDNIPENLK